MVPDLPGFFDHEDLEGAARSLRELTDANRAGEARGTGTDKKNVNLQTVAPTHGG